MIELFYFVLFMLFFAVLAAGYFYLQRAKARDATPAEASASAADAAPASEPSATTGQATAAAVEDPPPSVG